MSQNPVMASALQPVQTMCNRRRDLADRFTAVRKKSLLLTAPLSVEDQCVQAMTETSPTKWHLAHTTWFFEVSVLLSHGDGYLFFDERYPFLFNSYYESLGPRHPRPKRGLLTRPTLEEVWHYRSHVDAAVCELMECVSDDEWLQFERLIVIGLAHEEQHQELMITDALYLLSCNPLEPPVFPDPAVSSRPLEPMAWMACTGGRCKIGHQGQGFCFDNECPAHDVLLEPYAMGSRPVTAREYLEFIEDGGYSKPQWWSSAGWEVVQQEQWTAPLYWAKRDGLWSAYGGQGRQSLSLNAPVTHISQHEAAAYAAWAGARLPTEFEWEAWARTVIGEDALHPPCPYGLGEVWEWTASAYLPYPRYRPWDGSLAEYNGKFMVGQYVLRGGSHATPKEAMRVSYRNFFEPATRWQFAGLRLAVDL